MAKETVVIDIQTNGDKAEGSVKSLKAQLREAQAEVAKMADKFGETSAQAIQAAKRAAELKDRIGDAKALTDAFNPDRKFQAFSSALSGVAGGFSAVKGAMGLLGAETENVEKMILQVNSAMALSQGLSAVTESIDAFKNLGSKIKESAVFQNIYNTATKMAIGIQSAFGIAVESTSVAFKALRGAIIATGIGALVVGIGMLVDKIIEWTSATDNQKLAEERLKKAEDDLKQSINETNKEIDNRNNLLDYQLKVELNNAKARGASLAELRKIEDQYYFNKRLNAQEDLFNEIKRTEELKKQYGEKTQIVKDQLAQEEKVRQIYFKTNQEFLTFESERRLQDYNNQKELNQKKKDDVEKLAKEILQANKQLNDEIKKQNDENFVNSIKDDRLRAETKLQLEFTNRVRDIMASKADAEVKRLALLEAEKKFNIDLQALKDKNAEEDSKKAKERLEKELKAEEETFDLITQARLSQIKDAGIKRQEEEANQYQKQIDKLYENYNNGLLTEQQFNAQREALKVLHEQKLTEIEKVNSEERKKTAEAEYQAKVSLWNQTGSAIGQLADVIGKSTGVGKALGLAQIAIDTGVAISALTRNSQANPANAVTGGIAGTIQFATGIVQILANIKKAKELLSSAKVPGGTGGGGGSMPSVSATAPVAPQMSQTALNQQLINQTGNAAVRSFVLESDVSGNQERIRRLNRAARIN